MFGTFGSSLKHISSLYAYCRHEFLLLSRSFVSWQAAGLTLDIFSMEPFLYISIVRVTRAVSWQATHTRNCQRIRRIAICIIGRTYDCRSYFAALAPSNATRSCTFNGPSRIHSATRAFYSPSVRRSAAKTMTPRVFRNVRKCIPATSSLHKCRRSRWYLERQNCLSLEVLQSTFRSSRFGLLR